jgi:hypothetical protein
MRSTLKLLVTSAALAFIHQAPAPTDAEALFARAVDVVRNDARAPFAKYTVVVTVTKADRRAVESWQTTEDVAHGIVLASSFSNEERANPTTPHGINIVGRRRLPTTTIRSVVPDLDTSTRWVNSPPVSSERSNDVVGPVALAVDQNFGLTPPRSYRLVDDQRKIADSADELTIIGKTGTTLPRYRVELLDTDGGIAHLGLTPLRNAYRNRLREIWLDTQTAVVQRAIVQGVGDRPPFDSVRWQVTFERREGATYVSDVAPLEPLKVGRDTVRLDIAFRNLTLLAQSPIATTFGIEAPVRYLRDP